MLDKHKILCDFALTIISSFKNGLFHFLNHFSFTFDLLVFSFEFLLHLRATVGPSLLRFSVLFGGENVG